MDRMVRNILFFLYIFNGDFEKSPEMRTFFKEFQNKDWKYLYYGAILRTLTGAAILLRVLRRKKFVFFEKSTCNLQKTALY